MDLSRRSSGSEFSGIAVGIGFVWMAFEHHLRCLKHLWEGVLSLKHILFFHK